MRAELSRDDERLMLTVTPKGGFPKKDSPPPPAPPPVPVAFYAPDRLFMTEGDTARRSSFARPTGRSRGSAWAGA